MKEPNLVADCLSEMVSSTKLPVTVKTRIGYDNVEDYQNIYNFINLLSKTGVKTFIMHARKAMLGKFTPKQNLNIPPLKYEIVYKLKKDFPNLEIIINGGITNTDQIKNHLKKVDGVMVGRSIYHSPYFLAEIEKTIYSTEMISTREEVIKELIDSRSSVEVGAQNFHPELNGAFTGEVSISQINDIGVNYALIGHSERRTLFKESNSLR